MTGTTTLCHALLCRLETPTYPAMVCGLISKIANVEEVMKGYPRLVKPIGATAVIIGVVAFTISTASNHAILTLGTT